MSKLSILELLNNSISIYRSKRTRKAKSAYLIDLQQLTGYKSIKTIIRHLNPPQKSVSLKKRGRSSKLRNNAILLLKKLWLQMDQPCGKRFVSMLPEWLPHWTNSNKVAPPGQLERILGVSSSTLDRVLAPFRISEAKRKKTSSLTALKSNIPLVDTQRRICTAGYFYADTVAHCGTTTKGDFAWTLTLTDDYTQWVCNQAVWNKGQYGCQAFDKLLREIPFKIKGINTDNGGEFINYHLQGYFKNRDKKCEITRSRPMHKNDNARAEEKNRHKVRDLIGYDRLDDERFVNILNEIYKCSNLLNNHFSACMKIISKERIGSKIIKRYDKARIPYAKFMEEAKKSGNKTKLLKLHQSLNPFELQEKIEDGLKKLIELKIKCEEEERGLLAPLTPSAAFDAAPGSNN